MVSQSTMIGVCAGMGFLVVITIAASIIYFYRLGAFNNCKTCCKKKPKPLRPKRADSGKTMNLEEFEEYLIKLHANSDLLFTEEYSSLGPHCSDRTAQTASIAVNAEKNRYVAVVPYDQTRVRLRTISGVPGSNYINASYIDGHNRRAAYAATQAPLSQTIADFWRMVWETKSRIIVMVTNLIEKGRVKGEQYWPTTGNVEFEGFKVTINNEKKYNQYIIRQFTVTYHKTNEQEETRVIWHYHYTAWPDHGVPDDASILISFIIRTREHEKEFSAPTIVHCSAGVGRTGTFIVLDAQMRQYDQYGLVNIYMYLMKIRTQRNYLVQQECQYIFIHDAIFEYMKAGGTRIATDELELNIAVRYSTMGKTITCKIIGEWELLSKDQIAANRINASKKTVNLDKNRSESILCVDASRVYLQTGIRVEGSDYINATRVDSFYAQNAYIITQTPMENTIEDFWRMNFENQVSIIINLLSEEEISNAENHIVPYIPESLNSSIICGGYEIKLIEENSYENFYRRHLILSESTDTDLNKEFIDIYHYHFTKWPGDLYPLGNNLIKFIHNIFACQLDLPALPQGSGVDIRPIVIHDLEGSWRAAVLSMIFHLKEQLEDNGPFIDVFSPVRIMKGRRTDIITNINHYNHLYKLLFSIIQYVNQYILRKDGNAKKT